MDVTNDDHIANALTTIEQWVAANNKPFVGLVNNAGISMWGPFETRSMKDIRSSLIQANLDSIPDDSLIFAHFCITSFLLKLLLSFFYIVMEVNYFGAVALTKTFLPILRASKGRVINISSIGGMFSIGAHGTYAATKFALDAFTDGLRKEVRPQGIAVVGINPGLIKTSILDKMLSSGFTKPDDVEGEVWDLYDRYLVRAMHEKLSKFADDGSTTKSTNADILHAIISARPYSRYFPGNLNGLPAAVVVFFNRVLPNYVIDFMAEHL